MIEEKFYENSIAHPKADDKLRVKILKLVQKLI